MQLLLILSVVVPCLASPALLFQRQDEDLTPVFTCPSKRPFGECCQSDVDENGTVDHCDDRMFSTCGDAALVFWSC